MSKRKRPKRRKSARDIKKELRAIYANKDGKVPDLTKLETRNGSAFTRWMLRIILILTTISALAWAGFFVFFSGNIFQDDEHVALEIEGPDVIKSGEETTYIFRYENISDVPLASLNIKLNLPSTFHIYSSIPEPNKANEWTIGSLSAGSDGAITITGVFLAEVPSEQRIQSLATYKPANFSSEFQDIFTQKIAIEDSVLALSLEGPEKALAGDESEYVLNVQNTGMQTVHNMRVIPRLPTDFTIESAKPELTEGQTYWNIPSLEPGELIDLTFTGTYTSGATGTQEVTTEVVFMNDTDDFTQATETHTTEILGGSANFSVIINGSTDDQTAEVGETLRLSIDYANNSAEIITDPEFTLTLTSKNGSPPIIWSQASLNGGTRSGSEITWRNLDDLEPQSSEILDLTLPLATDISGDVADNITFDAIMTINGVGDVSSTRTLESTPITVSLNSDVRLATNARYYDTAGTAVGSGPLPPEVDETTTVRVYWQIENNLHTLEDITLSTTLPSGVNWLDDTQTQIGSLSYNTTTRQISWTIPKLLTEISSAQAWFDLSFTPTSSDIGRFVKLTNTTSFSGKDTITGQEVTDSLNPVSTDFSNDSYAEGQGVVVE